MACIPPFTLLISLSLLTLFIGVVKGRAKTYDGILKSLKHPDQLVLDISSINQFNHLFEESRSSEKFFNMEGQGDTSIEEKSGVRLTPTVYFNPDEEMIHGKDPGPGLNNLYNPSRNQSFLFVVPSKLNPLYNASFPMLTKSMEMFSEMVGASKLPNVTLIFKLPPESNFPIESESEASNTLFDLIRSFKSKWRNIKLGIQIRNTPDDNLLKNDNLLSVLNLMDIAILDVDITPRKFQYSYSRFKTNLGRTLDQSKKSLLFNCTIYAKLNFPVEDEKDDGFPFCLTDKLYHRYYFYLLHFSTLWANELNNNERLILPTFNTSLANVEGFDGAELKNILVVNSNLRIDQFSSNPCEIKTLMEHASQNFSTMKITRDGWSPIEKNGSLHNCIYANDLGCPKKELESEVCNRPILNSTLPNINLHYFQYPPSSHFQDELGDMASSLKGFSWNLLELARDQQDFPSDLEAGLTKLPSQVGIACGVFWRAYLPHGDELFKVIQHYCGPVWNQTKVIVWNVLLIYGADVDLNDAPGRLVQFASKRQEFLEKYPDKVVMLRVELIKASFGGRRKSPPYGSFHGSLGLYCSRDIMEANEMAEVVINFGKMNHIPLEFKRGMAYNFGSEEGGFYGGWIALKTVEGLNMEELKFPVFVARDFPRNFVQGEMAIDPCLPWNRQVPDGGVPMDHNSSGTTVYMGGMKDNALKVTLEELELMLLFTLHKFSLVEIVPASLTDLETVSQLLSRQHFLDAFEKQGNTSVNIHLSIDFRIFDKAEEELEGILEKLAKAVLKPVGVHFANWNRNNNRIHVSDELTKNLKGNNVTLGISLEDCVEEVNGHFGNLENFQHFSQVDYILCNIKQRREASNVDELEMTRYLDSTLYIQKYFQRLFPSERKVIYFRLNSNSTMSMEEDDDDNGTILEEKADDLRFREKVSSFLTFFSDVSQYGSLNQMKFFMFPAFDDAKGSGSRFGWWRILNHEDLTNASVFIEKEAEHLGQDTWRPPKEIGTSTNWNGFAVVILCTVVLLLIVTVIGIRFWYRRQFALLSRKEVGIFQYGKSDGNEEEITFDSRMFPKEFEIPRSKFILLNVIGRGNFGLVYNANLTADDEEGGTVQVAVKIPHPGSSKSSFKTILSELKVLSYVGVHPNVLQFVGAYTKEIGRGVVYIATELCRKGALQEYLRKLYSELDQPPTTSLSSDGTEEQVELQPNSYGLCRFAQEIANGMEYIASRKIVHGDLSTRNVLLDLELHCKIADFGLSRKLYECQEYVKKTTEPLPWRWMALETLKRMEFTTKSDVWSYGVTLWEIFSLGSIPYPGLSWTTGFLEELETGGRQLSPPKYSTNDIHEKILLCCNINPELRPGFQELSQYFGTLLNKEYIQV